MSQLTLATMQNVMVLLDTHKYKEAAAIVLPFYDQNPTGQIPILLTRCYYGFARQRMDDGEYEHANVCAEKGKHILDTSQAQPDARNFWYARLMDIDATIAPGTIRPLLETIGPQTAYHKGATKFSEELRTQELIKAYLDELKPPLKETEFEKVFGLAQRVEHLIYSSRKKAMIKDLLAVKSVFLAQLQNGDNVPNYSITDARMGAVSRSIDETIRRLVKRQ